MSFSTINTSIHIEKKHVFNNISVQSIDIYTYYLIKHTNKQIVVNIFHRIKDNNFQ